MRLSSRNSSRHQFVWESSDSRRLGRRPKRNRDYIRNELKKTYAEASRAMNAVYGWDATTVEEK